MKQWLKKILLRLLFEDKFGANYQTVNMNPITLVDAVNIDWDLSNGELATVTLAGNRTMNAPTNMVNGHTMYLIVIQSGGGNTLALSNAVFKFPGGTEPTLSAGAGAIDILTFITDGTTMYGNMLSNFS